MTENKKNFRMNPAYSFISQESIDAVEGRGEQESGTKKTSPAVVKAPEAAVPAKPAAPAGEKKVVREAKSRRVQMLMKPSDYEALQNKAELLGLSVNEAINEAIKIYIS